MDVRQAGRGDATAEELETRGKDRTWPMGSRVVLGMRWEEAIASPGAAGNRSAIDARLRALKGRKTWGRAPARHQRPAFPKVSGGGEPGCPGLATEPSLSQTGPAAPGFTTAPLSTRVGAGFDSSLLDETHLACRKVP